MLAITSGFRIHLGIMYWLRRSSWISLLFLIVVSPAQSEDRHWFQVRIYHLTSEKAAKLFDKTFEEALVPAFKRQGIAELGVFQPVNLSKDKALPLQRYVISVHASPEELGAIGDKLGEDTAFREGAAEYVGVSKDDAIFSRVESSLLYAFEGMPKFVLPKRDSDEPRLFELRVYESYSEIKGKLKVDMFNKGEIDIFNAVGLNCLFFGEAVVGKNLPQLTYMAVYNDEDHRKEVWQKFLKHPDWTALKGLERYKETVSKIISQHMRALPYSPIQ